MRSDEEIERLLEDWLEGEARPIPREMLENALETVARTPQSGRRPDGLGWIGSRPFGIVAAAALIILVATAAGLAAQRIGSLLPTASANPQIPHTWDPAADWRRAPNQENPSPDRYGNRGVWSYLRSTSSSHDPANYILMPNFADEKWDDPGSINLLVALAEEDTINLHPWSDGTLNRNAILAWTSPIDGAISIRGTVARPQDPCPAATETLLFSVDQGSDTLQSLGLDLGQVTEFALPTTVARGDTIYFVVDANTNASCGVTALQVTINSGIGDATP